MQKLKEKLFLSTSKRGTKGISQKRRTVGKYIQSISFPIANIRLNLKYISNINNKHLLLKAHENNILKYIKKYQRSKEISSSRSISSFLFKYYRHKLIKKTLYSLNSSFININLLGIKILKDELSLPRKQILDYQLANYEKVLSLYSNNIEVLRKSLKFNILRSTDIAGYYNSSNHFKYTIESLSALIYSRLFKHYKQKLYQYVISNSSNYKKYFYYSTCNMGRTRVVSKQKKNPKILNEIKKRTLGVELEKLELKRRYRLLSAKTKLERINSIIPSTLPLLKSAKTKKMKKN
jgi:hypothetical protein